MEGLRLEDEMFLAYKHKTNDKWESRILSRTEL